MHRFSNRPFPATTLSFLSSRAYPDFLLHCFHRRPRMWFSSKRTTRSRPKPQLSTGNPGKPRDLRCAIRVPRPYRPTTSPLSSCLPRRAVGAKRFADLSQTEGFIARSRRTPRVLILSILFGAFRPPKPEDRILPELLL